MSKIYILIFLQVCGVQTYLLLLCRKGENTRNDY
nr:MAG TPA: hypothetical protein [Caudoviricetes sp.]DAI19872.1 MAG TPA: hypothetical protein [Caudoviricetes sp.]